MASRMKTEMGAVVTLLRMRNRSGVRIFLVLSLPELLRDGKDYWLRCRWLMALVSQGLGVGISISPPIINKVKTSKFRTILKSQNKVRCVCHGRKKSTIPRIPEKLNLLLL